MGNDGGSIPTRRELVKEAARNPTTAELKETVKEQQAHRWTYCSVSHEHLRKPIVSDSAGVLHNKDAIIQYLLPAEASTIDKVEYDKVLCGRVKSLKDVVEVLFEDDPTSKNGNQHWICPVTSKRLGPAVKAVYLVPCGHAFSHEAVKEMKGSQCLQCGHVYEESNIIPILPTGKEDAIFLENRLEKLQEQGLTHSLKKASGSGKKRKANGVHKTETEVKEVKSSSPNLNGSATIKSLDRPSMPLSRTSTPKISDGIMDAATANLTAKVLEEEEAKKKRRRLLGENENIKSLFTKSEGNQKHKGDDFMTRGYSITANARHM